MTEDQELRCTALAMAIRALNKRGELFAISDVRQAAEEFHSFLVMPPEFATKQPTRPMTAEEFYRAQAQHAQQGLGGSF